MAFDGIFLNSVLNELKSKIINCKIDKINQPEKDELFISFRGIKKDKLCLSASSTFPRIHFTKVQKQNPIKAPMFCMVLRKYLLGGKVLDITQPHNDRIIVMKIESSDELGFDSIYNLIIEIMGRHSNISLVRDRDNKIIDSIKHVSSSMNSYRVLLPNAEYVNPPKDNKMNPFYFTKDELSEKFALEDFKETWFSKVFTGVSKPLSKEIYNELKDMRDINVLFNSLKEYFKNISTASKFYLYKDKVTHDLKDFYCTYLNIYKDYAYEEFSNSTDLLDYYYSKKDKQDRLHNKASHLLKLITTNIDRCLKKEKILKNTLEECEKKEKYKVYGDLLTSYIYTLKKGLKNITLQNFYSENQEDVTIPLDENKTPSQNVQSYYKKYNKLKKSETSCFEQLELNSLELNYLNSVLLNLKSVESYGEIDEIKDELISSSYIKFKKRKDKKSKPSKPMHFISSDGIDIYVGKNNYQNDFLTLKFSSKNDTWLHTKDIPGSHVIIKSTTVPEKTLEEAAVLAAFHSKAKASSKVAIDYTLVKNVRKPSGAKPGMVIYLTNSTVFVDPYDIELTRID